MPTSSKLGKKEIVEWINENKLSIHRILDLGIGSGTYSKLLSKNNLREGMYLVGVEAWKPYISQYKLEEMYDVVVNEDVRSVDWKLLGNFDVVFAGDILEHMTKEDAVNVVSELLKYSKTIIMSIPIVYMPQDEYEGNPFEIHVKPDWSHDEVVDTWKNNITKTVIGLKKDSPKIGIYWLEK
jgi:predicted TPR repeat methyltransferase